MKTTIQFKYFIIIVENEINQCQILYSCNQTNFQKTINYKEYGFVDNCFIIVDKDNQIWSLSLTKLENLQLPVDDLSNGWKLLNIYDSTIIETDDYYYFLLEKIAYFKSKEVFTTLNNYNQNSKNKNINITDMLSLVDGECYCCYFGDCQSCNHSFKFTGKVVLDIKNDLKFNIMDSED